MGVDRQTPRTLSAQRKSYRITFVPEPICWSTVPDDIGELRSSASGAGRPGGIAGDESR